MLVESVVFDFANEGIYLQKDLYPEKLTSFRAPSFRAINKAMKLIWIMKNTRIEIQILF